MSRFFSWIQAGRKVRRPERFRPQVVQLEDRNCPAVFTVTTTADIAGPPTPGELSLRQAIDAVNASADLNNTIILSSGTYGITVTSATENNNSGGDFDINPTHGLNLVIQGRGPGSTIINANGVDRAFQIFGNNSGVHVTFNDLQITGGNVSGNGGGIYLNDSSQAANVDGVTLNDVLLTKNTSGFDGGGIYANEGSITLSGSIVSNNTAAYNAGGGIAAGGGDISLSASAVTGNTSSNDAGGVDEEGSNGRVTIINNSSITNNTAAYNDGGGLDDEATTGALTIDSSSISGNVSGRDGGGLEYDGNSISISNSRVENNRAGGSGGGIETDGSTGTMTISGSIISGDRANTSSGYGGGLYNDSVSTTTITGSAFNNDAAEYGGAIYDAYQSANMSISNTDLSGNVASDSGGGMYLDATSGTSAPIYHLSDVTLNNDAAFTGAGGAIDVESATSLNLDTVHVQNDTAGGSSGGGGIFNNATDTLVFDNSTFTNDLATGGPGGAVEDTSASFITISGSILSGNRAEGGSGGGMEAQANSTTGQAIITGSAFNNDLATNFGGGFDFDGTNLSVQNSQFLGDKSGSSGGGLYSAGSTTSLIASTVENDTAARFLGGGVDVNNITGQLTVDHSVISGNVSGLDGGGLYANGHTVTVEYSQLDNNASLQSDGGGGIRLSTSSADPLWIIEYSTIAFDKAEGGGGDGGGIQASSSNTTAGLLMILNSTIAGDIASGNGGGVAIEGAGNKLAVEFLFATLDSNQASNQGGGIYNAETAAGMVTLGNTIVADDSASSAANGPDIFSAGTIADLVLQPGSQTVGHNIIGTAGAGEGYTGLTNGTNGDQLGVNPLLNPIGNNGGPTLTQSLQAGSPAVDAGTSPSDVTAITTTDQRGVTRPDGGTDNPDVGAFESNLG